MKNEFEKEHQPIIHRVYDYIKEHHLGRENGIHRPELAKKLNINERELRKITREINISGEFEKLISTTYCCFMCDTKEECTKSIKNTYKTAISLFKKAKRMEKKVGLNGQLKIKLGKDYQDVIETFSDDEE